MTVALKKDFDETDFKNEAVKFQNALAEIKRFNKDGLDRMLQAFMPLGYDYGGTEALTQLTVETI